jgi:glycosyltransferase involved in cell wall biosynthesis
MNKERVLISTIQPLTAGVSEMVRFAAGCIVEAGYTPVIAYYLPYGASPELSVPCFKLLQDRVGEQVGTAVNGFEAHGLGAWLPGLEFTHYLPTRHWKELIRSCRYYLAVSSNSLAAAPFALLNRAYMAWVAGTWLDDRKERANGSLWPGKVLDFAVNRRVIGRLEKIILDRGTVVALSRYTRERLGSRGAQRPIRRVLPMPVDLDFFRPAPGKVTPRRIGFSGRLDDPRENAGLLLRTVEECRRRGVNVEAELIGHPAMPDQPAATFPIGANGAVRVVGCPERERLAERLQALDVFVIPSPRGGSCIAALEAMACGCPVVSTRCGWAEEFVIPDQTGCVVASDPESIADAVLGIVKDRGRRASFSENARSLVECDYKASKARRIFWDAFYEAFPQ